MAIPSNFINAIAKYGRLSSFRAVELLWFWLAGVQASSNFIVLAGISYATTLLACYLGGLHGRQ